MDSPNYQYLNDKLVQEIVRGGGAYYRPAHQAANRFAHFLAERREAKAEAHSRIKFRVLSIKLPGLWAIIRLPKWVPVGKPLD
jgi:hypothetical protein